MPEPLVSVLIPMYNHAKYIAQCLDSVVNDGWTNLEVVMLDDGSKDNSYEIAQEWREAHPKVFTHFVLNRQTNQGLTRSLNRLIGQSQGEFITLLASDDGLLPGGIAARVRALESHPEWLAVIGDSHLTKENGEVYHTSGTLEFAKRDLKVMENPKLLKRELILRWWVPGPTLLLRRTAYTTLGLYDEKLLFEDRDMYLRLLSKNALGYVNYPVAFYRFDPERFQAKASPEILASDAMSDRKNAASFSQPLKTILLLRAAMQTYASRFARHRKLADWFIWKILIRLFNLVGATEKLLRR
jgi:glycosyltransferase involved in cell wall biosynthesis